jgi:hypothetical protein
MRNTFSNSWELVRASGQVLNRDRALLLFPLLSGVASVGLAASFIVPTMVLGGPEALFQTSTSLGLLLAFLFYLAQYFVVFYFNAALVGAALIHLDGGRPTLRDGLAIASDHAAPILGYAAISATVGLFLNSAGRNGGFFTRLGSLILGLSWNLATFLAVPVLVTRDVGPIQAVKESARLLRSSWGEQISGTVGMGLVFGVAGVLLGIASAALLSIGAVAGPLSLIPTVVALVLAWVLFALVTSSLQGIYRAAVYRYAVTGLPGAEFAHIPLDEVVQTPRNHRGS